MEKHKINFYHDCCGAFSTLAVIVDDKYCWSDYSNSYDITSFADDIRVNDFEYWDTFNNEFPLSDGDLYYLEQVYELTPYNITNCWFEWLIVGNLEEALKRMPEARDKQHYFILYKFNKDTLEFEDVADNKIYD